LNTSICCLKAAKKNVLCNRNSKKKRAKVIHKKKSHEWYEKKGRNIK